jgi:hypothetical protein
MGAHIFTRIQNTAKNDFIDLHDRHWDGDLTNFKKELKSNNEYWNKFVDSLQSDIINAEYDFNRLIQWAENFENFLHIQSCFPTIENSAALFSMRSFNHSHCIPFYNHESKQLLDFWGYQKPELLALSKGQSFSFLLKEKKIILEPKPVDLKEFKIVRIQSTDDNGKKTFLDIKVRLFNRKDFLFHVLGLPEFWRNFHFVSRKKKEKGAIVHPAYNINKTLNAFYTPAKSFSITSVIGKNKKEIFEKVKSESPFSLYVNNFAMHLFFSLPGLALPLTAREQEWSAREKPEMTISLNENEVTLITVDYSESSEENRSILQEFSDSFSEREQNFAKFFELGQYSGGQYLLTTSEEFAFVYEANMIELFDSLTKFDEHKSI